MRVMPAGRCSSKFTWICPGRDPAAVPAPSTRIAFTEAVWLSEARPRELQDWRLAGYPAMGCIDTCLARVRRSGFAVIDRFVLPESAWE